VTTRDAARIAVALVAVAIVGASLTGCSRAALAGQQAPAAATSVTPTSTPAPAAASGDDSSLQGIQGDLDSANSATANAGGDVADADRSAATSDSP
jgi:hypothetical protein